MGERAVKVKILHGEDVLTEVEIPHCQTLPGLVQALDNVKKSVNDFLTNLIDSSDANQSHSLTTNNNEEEEEDTTEDPLSGILNEITGGSYLGESQGVKRRSNRTKNAKR